MWCIPWCVHWQWGQQEISWPAEITGQLYLCVWAWWRDTESQQSCDYTTSKSMVLILSLLFSLSSSFFSSWYHALLSGAVCWSWRCVAGQPQGDQDHPRYSGDCGDREDQFQSQEDHSNSWSMDQQTATPHWTDTTTEGMIKSYFYFKTSPGFVLGTKIWSNLLENWKSTGLFHQIFSVIFGLWLQFKRTIILVWDTHFWVPRTHQGRTKCWLHYFLPHKCMLVTPIHWLSNRTNEVLADVLVLLM